MSSKWKDKLSDYLMRCAVSSPWQVEGALPLSPQGAIIIPCLAESANLPLLLDSLSSDRTLPVSRLAVVVVVNNRLDASEEHREDNRRCLKLLRSARSEVPFPLLLIDAATAGRELPLRDGGVGLARKIGHDLMLPLLDYTSGDPLLISLDSDTTVADGYAAAIIRHFAGSHAGGAIIPFRHRNGANAAEDAAIIRYELFLRSYQAGIGYAGSPYAFQTVGSAMACRASAYLKTGGMNRRQAGEDFYFLQALFKTSGVTQVPGTEVFPSPRRSWRVPFGTGRSVGALLDNDSGAVLFYQPCCFHLLKSWLELAGEGSLHRWDDLQARSMELSPLLHEYLEGQNFDIAWKRLLQNNRTEERLLKGFHDWFDAFRTMKLLHLMSDRLYPRGEPDLMLPLFPEAWGDPELDNFKRIEWLRTVQGK